MENWVPGPGAAQINGKFPTTYHHLGFANSRHYSVLANGALPPGMVLRLCPEPSRNHLPFHWKVLPHGAASGELAW